MEEYSGPGRGQAGTGDDWRNLLGKELNPPQFEFVTTAEEKLLGLAGPGSGKTRALVYRAANLIKIGTAPEELLLLTFTNKAAGEMKDRLEQLLGFLPYRLWAGTFHSIGARILRRHAHLVGRKPNFSIYDEDDSRGLLKQILKTLPVSEDEIKLLQKRGFVGRVISQARNSALSIQDVMREYFPYRINYLELVEEVSAIYEEKKRDSNAFDFDDLLLCWLDLFERHPQVKEQYRRRFGHVLVDEFQDTNVVQAAIIDLFAGAASICVVGDDAQSIYAFRYAHVGNILSFPEKHAGCCLVRMEQNYRSTPEIVNLANCSIAHNRGQLPKELYSKNPPGPLPVIAAMSGSRQEASYVLQTTWELQNSGVPLDEIAVLYRSSYLTPEVEFALSRKGIGYRTYGGLKFFQKAHIKDLLAYLKIINNPGDESAWRRVTLLQPGLGPATFDTLWKKLKLHENPLEAALKGEALPSRGRPGWQALCRTLGRVSAMGGSPVPAILEAVMEDSYEEILVQNYPDQFEERTSGIERLIMYSESYENLAAFLESLSLEESLFSDTSVSPGEREKQLTLSTIHSAKGKEWEAVFIIGMNEGQFPRSREEEGELDEERRLFYVAATRARRYLYLLTYREEYRPYGVVSKGPSLFLRELPPECYRLADCADSYY